MYKTKRPPMYKSTVKRVTYPKMFIRRERKWCYHFFMLKFEWCYHSEKGRKQRYRNVQTHSLAVKKDENVNVQLIFVLKNEHLHFLLTFSMCECTFTFFWLTFPAWEWTFHTLNEYLHWLSRTKFDWKFRVNPLNWSRHFSHRRGQPACIRECTFTLFPAHIGAAILYCRNVHLHFSPARLSTTHGWMGSTWMNGTSWPCTSRLCAKMYIL